jgi:hypothetical protein
LSVVVVKLVSTAVKGWTSETCATARRTPTAKAPRKARIVTSRISLFTMHWEPGPEPRTGPSKVIAFWLPFGDDGDGCLRGAHGGDDAIWPGPGERERRPPVKRAAPRGPAALQRQETWLLPKAECSICVSRYLSKQETLRKDIESQASGKVAPGICRERVAAMQRRTKPRRYALAQGIGLTNKLRCRNRMDTSQKCARLN